MGYICEQMTIVDNSCSNLWGPLEGGTECPPELSHPRSKEFRHISTKWCSLLIESCLRNLTLWHFGSALSNTGILLKLKKTLQQRGTNGHRNMVEHPQHTLQETSFIVKSGSNNACKVLSTGTGKVYYRQSLIPLFLEICKSREMTFLSTGVQLQLEPHSRGKTTEL
jgi:hypothetical protein